MVVVVYINYLQLYLALVCQIYINCIMNGNNLEPPIGINVSRELFSMSAVKSYTHRLYLQR